MKTQKHIKTIGVISCTSSVTQVTSLELYSRSNTVEMNSYYFKNISAGDFLRRRLKSNFVKFIQDEYYSVITRPSNQTITSFMKPENEAKNRYLHIPCWDDSRVILHAKDGRSDYIHANWIDGFEKPKKFIATQGPLANTTADFWRLVWQQSCYVIVMLTRVEVNDEEMCHQYWCLQENESLVADEFCIETLKVTARFNYTRTILKITNKSSKSFRILTHFQCTNWFEHIMPDVGWLVYFVKMVDRVQRAYMNLSFQSRGVFPCPVVVHCSAGVGRTGVFCTLDICLNQLMKSSELCIPRVVLNVRIQRYAGVLNFKQYFFIYQVLDYFLRVQEIINKPTIN